MRTMHAVLPIGAYDRDGESLPVAEFEIRLAAIRRVMAERGWDGVVVFGDCRDFAALSWLTGFTPKLRPAYVLASRDGEARLLAGGGGRMLPAAKALTWLDDVRGSVDVATEIPTWLDEMPGTADRAIGLCGGDGMPVAAHQAFVEACGPNVSVENADEALRCAMARKSPGEVARIRRASEIVGLAMEKLVRSWSAGAGTAAAVLEAESAARSHDVEDIRTLFSLDGGRTLRPYEGLSEVRSDPLVAYMAVRRKGYWAEGMITHGARQSDAYRKAVEALHAVIGAATVGAGGDELVRVIDAHIAPYGPHPVTANRAGYAIGVAPEEAPHLVRGGDARLQDGGVYSLQVGIADARAGCALLSAMVLVRPDGNEVLWSSA